MGEVFARLVRMNDGADLRLLGLARQLSVADLAQHLLRWARLSLLLVIPSGFLMFVAHATEMAENPAFRLKLLLIVVAGLYLGAWLLATRFRFLADRELATLSESATRTGSAALPEPG